ncbi:hypothetical protein [Streptomyces sp. NPDC086023]|uniref:hypothetical protein n=1 Tax=Streptomyces sp. NPDC086023 TaxID=3365746 RepID=UPI0037CFB6F4
MSRQAQPARRARMTLAGLGLLAAALLAGGGYAAATLLGDGDGSDRPAGDAKPSVSAPPKASPGKPPMTPARAKKITLDSPKDHKDGVAVGFEHTPRGAISAAVYWWEEYAWLDDRKARQQLNAVVSPDATGYVDEQVSEIRAFRERLGLPPSGGTSGILFSTSVHAVRPSSMDVPGEELGDVVEIWMSYDRFATGPDGAPDKDPLRGETTNLFLRWQDGAWRLTNQPEYVKQESFPVAYDPDSPYAWNDGWVQVRHGD